MSTPLLVDGKLKLTENEIVKYLVNTFPGTEQTIAAGSIGMGENEASHIDLTGENGMDWPGHLTTERTTPLKSLLPAATVFAEASPDQELRGIYGFLPVWIECRPTRCLGGPVFPVRCWVHGPTIQDSKVRGSLHGIGVRLIGVRFTA